MAPNSAPYNMAKAALEALAWTLAKEERRNGIHVNVVAPGLVDTEMGRRLVKGAMGVEDIRTMDAARPFGHVCTPEEVADAVRFVVSEQAVVRHRPAHRRRRRRVPSSARVAGASACHDHADAVRRRMTVRGLRVGRRAVGRFGGERARGTPRARRRRRDTPSVTGSTP